MREVVEKRIAGCRLVGTVHRAQASDGRPAKPGVLLLNSGFLPRSAIGDIAVQMGDYFAHQGFTTFRFDLPGLGDSDGELPADTQNFFAGMTRGRYAKHVAPLAAQLQQEFGLSGMFLGGICGGAVTAIFSAIQPDRNFKTAGLILLDPAFSLVPPLDIETRTEPAATSANGKVSFPRRVYLDLRQRLLKTAFGEKVHEYHQAKFKPHISRLRLAVRKFWRGSLPENANRALISGWLELARAGLPMIVFLAGDENKQVKKFDYLGYIDAAARRATATTVTIRDTTHAFVEGSGVPTVLDRTSTWMTQVTAS